MRHYFAHIPPKVRRPLAWSAACVLVSLAAFASSLLDGATMGLAMFSLHTALTLGLAIRFGLAFALAGALGAALFSLISGAGLFTATIEFLGTSLGAICAATLTSRLKPYCKTEVSKRFLQLGLACSVFAPIVAGALMLTATDRSSIWAHPMVGFLTHCAFLAFSAVLFAPLVLTWLPKSRDKVQVAAFERGVSRIVMVLIGLGLLAAHWAGAEKAFLTGQIFLVTTLFLSLVPAFLGSERASASTIALVASVVVLEQLAFVQGGASLLKLDVLQRVGLVAGFMFLGAWIGHILNGMAIRTAQQQIALKEQVLRHPFSGLVNRRYFFKVLNEITMDRHRQSEMLAEIAIPDLKHWAEFSGREAAFQFDARIVEKIDFALKDYAHFVAHGMFGSYFIRLKSTADPLAIIGIIESAVHEACALYGAKGMKLRPQVALLRVPRDVAVTTEDILATMSHALARSTQSLKRWSMASLQTGLLQKQRQESLENEIIVESLSSSLVKVFVQTIQPVQGQSKPGLHFEVLARLQNLQGGFVSPARFLPVYATCGLLPQFDRQVIQALFEAFELEPEFVQKISACSINLTGPTLSDPDLIAFIEAQFAGALIKPQQIVFEITESDKITSPIQALENVEELRRMGASIALDDFGTGLASFEYLKLFKPDWIKIDGSFVRDALLNPLGAEVVASMIRVARAAGCHAVAEQVEDQATIDFMKQLGAHFVQGYAISKPRPLTEMIEAVRDLSSTISSNGQGDSAHTYAGERRANPSIVATQQTKLRNVIELGI
jgi:EAL domain-containing protein (putative c-di-GMP-specific phosphodiesterase class I)